MKIINKFAITFLLVFLLILFGGYFSIKTSESILEKSIEKDSLLFISGFLENIDRIIHRRIEIFQEYSRDLILLEGVTKSNLEFEKLENIQEFIDSKDKEWTSVPKETITPFMRSLMNNRLAHELQEKLEFYKEKYGYPLIGEIILTNKYGANAAITGKTTDYRQDDEEWWQAAKQNGLYVKDVEFDESAGVNSIDIGIGIRDEAGNFIGAFKIVYNIREVINELKDISKSPLFSIYKKTRHTLMNQDGKVIFPTDVNKPLQDSVPVPSHKLSKDGFPSIEKKRSPHGNFLSFHSHSKGYKHFKGLGWIYTLQYELNEIFAPSELLKKTLWIITLLVGLLTIGIGLLLSTNIRKLVGGLNDELKKREITEKALQESKARVLEAQRVALLGFWDWDIVGNTLHWSDESCNIFAISPNEFDATYEAFVSFVHPDDKEFVKRSIDEALYEKKTYNIDHRIILPDGSERVVHAHADVTFDAQDKPIRMLGTVQDVTKRKMIESNLKDLAEELEWKNLSLRKANEEAGKATEIKEQFVELVAHDLRTPLSSIMGFLNILHDESDHPIQPEQKAMVKIVLNNAEKMIHTIEGLLNLSRLQSGQIIPKPDFFDAHSISDMVLERLNQLAKEKNIELTNEVPEGIRFYADYELYHSVIQNLVSNAIKFCKKGDRVSLFVPQGKKSTMAVKDTGIGIEEEFLPDIFKKEVNTSTKGTAGEKGSGLGLPYAYEIIKAHGGNLTVESELEKGSVFFAELPYMKPRILVVDDDRETRLMLKMSLEKIETDTLEAENGEAALTLLKGKEIHLIIADIRMPGMGGFELLKKVKKDPATKDIPIILITGQAMKTKEKAIGLGASDFITKPLNMEKFINKVRRFVN